MAKNSDKDKEMAKHMKMLGVTRTTGCCPLCHNVIGLPAMYSHIALAPHGKRLAKR